MRVTELSEREGFKIIAMPDGDRNIDGVYIGDLLSWVMGRASQDNAWITIMSNINIVAVASLVDVSCIILAEGVSLEKNVIETAEAKGINIFSTDKSAYETAVLLSSCI